MNELRDSPFGGSHAVAAFKQARLVLAASAVCEALHDITANRAEFEQRIADLKLLAGTTSNSEDKIRCCTEILGLRSLQLRAECRPPPKFSDAGCDLRPQVPRPLAPPPTAEAFPGHGVGAVGNLSR